DEVTSAVVVDDKSSEELVDDKSEEELVDASSASAEVVDEVVDASSASSEVVDEVVDTSSASAEVVASVEVVEKLIATKVLKFNILREQLKGLRAVQKTVQKANDFFDIYIKLLGNKTIVLAVKPNDTVKATNIPFVESLRFQ
ncbi:unnamed protein product, partial [Polarella glacialis]